MKLGEPMKEKFLLDKSIAFVQHGSYGPVPKCVIDQKIKYIYEQESSPDDWFRVKHPKYYEESLAAAAKFMGAKPENLVLLDNVTTGINTVLKSLSFEPGDKIMVNSHAYGAIANAVKEQHDFKGVEIVNVEIPMPIKCEDELVDVFRKEYEKHKPIKLHVFDHITSVSALVFPVKKLAKLAKEYGTLSLIDGAHAPGQVDLNVEDIGADFYSADFYKWCYVARSCGFLWLSPDQAGKIRPLVTSHGYKQSLNDQFNYSGTRDCSSMFTIPRALQFYEEIGGLKALQSHADKVLGVACKSLAAALGTGEMDVPDSMKAPFMRLVRLPIDKPAQSLKRFTTHDDVREALTNMGTYISRENKIETMFTFISDVVYVRLSANAYTSGEDFRKLEESLILAKDHFNG